MVNKIKTRGVKRTKYSKRKRCSKYRKHYTRKFGKRIQRRVRRLSRSKKGGGGTFDLTISPRGDTRVGNIPPKTPAIYEGFALVKKVSNLFFSRETPRQVIIYKYKNRQGKTMLVFVKCKSDKNCDGTYDINTYKVYDMSNLEAKESDGDTMFVFDVDKGKGKYQIKLTEGANGYSRDSGIENLKNAIEEQQAEQPVV
jgi:hypothetical protein